MCWCGLQTKLESIDRKSWLSAAKSQWAWNRFQMRKLVKENAKKTRKKKWEKCKRWKNSGKYKCFAHGLEIRMKKK